MICSIQLDPSGFQTGARRNKKSINFLTKLHRILISPGTFLFILLRIISLFRFARHPMQYVCLYFTLLKYYEKLTAEFLFSTFNYCPQQILNLIFSSRRFNRFYVTFWEKNSSQGLFVSLYFFNFAWHFGRKMSVIVTAQRWQTFMTIGLNGFSLRGILRTFFLLDLLTKGLMRHGMPLHLHVPAAISRLYIV